MIISSARASRATRFMDNSKKRGAARARARGKTPGMNLHRIERVYLGQDVTDAQLQGSWAPVRGAQVCRSECTLSPYGVQGGDRAIVSLPSVTVIGAGLAGLRTVERLRHRGCRGRIVLLGAEPHLPYDRPPLSKQVLRGERDAPWLRPADDYAGLDVEVRLGEQVLELDADQRVLRTRDTQQLPYDVLVIATGASPRRVPGINGLVLRTLDHAIDLRGLLRPGARLAIIGAGLIGCEAAASARAMGVEVDLIDVLPGPLIRVVGAQVCNLVADLHRAHGVRLHMDTAAARVGTDAARVGAATGGAGELALADGTVLAADIVLEAVGAVPETGWLEGSQLRLDDGVVCDAEGRVAEDVYAVGDVARWDGRRSEHWTNAGWQADRVAAAILGQEPPLPEPAYWWSDQYDVKLQGLGAPGPDDDVQLISWGPKARTVALYARDGRLTGAVGFSAAAAVMRLRADITAGSAIGDVLVRLAPLAPPVPRTCAAPTWPCQAGGGADLSRGTNSRVKYLHKKS
jgi:3-phenylpropionate/trans-cinnamate dioxygenase ferredoxin reductase subunit